MRSCLLLLCALASSSVYAAPPINFSRDILPILSDNCFHCHGQDANKREADLRLDTQDGALRKDNPIVVPGKSGESELIRRIDSQDADEMMPPLKSNRALTPQQRELLRRWVDEGAAWGKHWAYEPPQLPTLPKVKKSDWPKNEIDLFVLARLEAEGLSPSPEADPVTLCRRLYLDLTGLPPTVEEVEDFTQSAIRNPQSAIEALVDRLLSSPRYGERMAWDWLDAARYADSNGYQGDVDRTMWPWRDWVVNAFNANMPFDQFTIEQLAGDMLPDATREQRLATGFCRNHMINGEGGRIAEESRVDYVMDQAETLATIWLGLTLNCCRCHDHKYDPLTQREYYGIFAFFNQTPVSGGGRSGQTPPVVDFASPEQSKRREELRKEYSALAKDVQEREKKLRDASFAEKDGQQVSSLPATIESALRKGPGDRAEQNREELIKFYKDSEPEYVALLSKLEKAKSARDSIEKSIPQVMVMEEMAKPRETFLLTRGAYDKPADKVEATTPASLPPLPKDAPRNRLGLARWLMSPENPLTARVTVNRTWQMLFGQGLVKTVEDFGVQGESPSHPELLDWLACRFAAGVRGQGPGASKKHEEVQSTRNSSTLIVPPSSIPPASLTPAPWPLTPVSPWDTKALLRLIVTSATYRQSSKTSAALLERDPENRLLARGARQRLPSWMIRDQALAVSGLLVDKPGGPSVKPYQPEGIWEEATFGKIAYKQDHGEALYRRSLYTFWRRIVGPTMFFDTAARQVCTVKAVRTNTPLHALTTLNDVTYVEAARALAQRVLTTKDASPATHVERAFRHATCRQPTEREQAILVASHERLKKKYAAGPVAATKLLTVGESKRDESLDPIEHAALTSLCTLILNLDETLSRQ